MNEKQQGGNVGVTFFLFCLAIVFAAFGFWHYSQSEDTAFHKILGLCRSCDADIKRHEKQIDEHKASMEKLNARMADVELAMRGFDEQLDIFRGQVGETREKQIQLKADLSKKDHKLVMPTGPIMVEIHSKPAIPNPPKKKLTPEEVKMINEHRAKLQKIQPKPETPQDAMKKIKKQLDGLSK
jgi:septal ring factor EnvC (AmiA/AmiB activator)